MQITLITFGTKTQNIIPDKNKKIVSHGYVAQYLFTYTIEKTVDFFY